MTSKVNAESNEVYREGRWIKCGEAHRERVYCRARGLSDSSDCFMLVNLENDLPGVGSLRLCPASCG